MMEVYDDDIFIDKIVTNQAPCRKRHSSCNGYKINGKQQHSIFEHESGSKLELKRTQKSKFLERRCNSDECDEIEYAKNGQLAVNPNPADDPIYIAPHLSNVLKPHQFVGVKFMYKNVIESRCAVAERANGSGCILAHSMGLGKTLQVITLVEIFCRVSPNNHVLIITPINVIQNWLSEFNRWMPLIDSTGKTIRNFSLFIMSDDIKGSEDRSKLLSDWHAKGGVLLIGYDMFRLMVQDDELRKKAKKSIVDEQSLNKQLETLSEEKKLKILGEERFRRDARKVLLSPGPDLVICDEGHRIKNRKTNIAILLSKIKTRRRIALTGYPLQNNLSEYYCMVEFVRPSFFGNLKQFQLRFERPILKMLHNDADEHAIREGKKRIYVLINMLREFVLRRSQNMLKKILPKSYEYIVVLRKSPIQHSLYKAFNDTIKQQVYDQSAAYNVLRAFAICIRIINHPDILYKVFVKRKPQTKKTWINSRSDSEAASTSWERDYHHFPTSHVSSFNNYHQNVVPNYYYYHQQIPFSGHFFPPFHYQHASNFAHHLPARPNLYSAYEGYNQPPIMRDNGSKISDIYAQNNSLNQMNIFSTQNLQSTSTNVNRNYVNSDRDSNDEFIGDLNGIDIEDRLEWANAVFCNDYRQGILRNSTKFQVAMQIIEKTAEIGDKLVLFSQSIETLDAFEQFLALQNHHWNHIIWARNQTYLRFDGTTSGSDREQLINRFHNESDLHLFLISTRAGSLGINLVAANRAIILDACFNPCHDSQAISRIYRYGQTKPTYIYRLIMDNSMERQIFNRQVSKHGLQKRIVDEQMVDANISTSEVQSLFEYDESLDVKCGKLNIDGSRLDDELLMSIIKVNQASFSQLPFLHETMLIENDIDLSNEEKLEAEEWYKNETMHENMSTERANFYNFSHHPRNGPDFAHLLRHQNNLNFNYRLHQPTPLQKSIELNMLCTPCQPMSTYNAVTLNRDIELPLLNEGTDTETAIYRLRAGEKIVGIQTSKGFYVRTVNGTILDASRHLELQRMLRQNLVKHPPEKPEVIQIDD